MQITVLNPGVSAVTDLGRFQTPILGVQTNGAHDQISARGANILVHNRQTNPVIEALALLPFSFRVDAAALISVTGAADSLFIDNLAYPTHTPLFVWPGATVSIPPAATGLRTYVGIHGCIQGKEFLGSYTFDPLTRSGLRLDTGMDVNVHSAHVLRLPDNQYFPVTAPKPQLPQITTLGLLPGPDAHEFPQFFTHMHKHVFTVDDRSDHVGLRLVGHVFERTRSTEILSRGVPVGAVEIPPAGEPIILLRGRPLTAGYPIPAVIGRGWHDTLGQLRPGSRIRFIETTQARSVSLAQSKADALTELAQKCTNLFTPLFP